MTDKRLEIVLAAKDATGRVFKDLETRFDRVKRQVFSLQGAFAALVGGYGLKRVAGSFLEAARTTEQYQTRLKVLLGSVEEGSRLFKEMSDYAGRVPFEFEEIMGAATQLAGVMRGGVDEIKEWMPMIGDLAAASGLSIQQTTEQVVRMYSAGAGAARLFRERGVLDMMGFQAGVSYSVEETRRKMFEEWQKTGSQFKGATDELAKTWDGMMSMLADKWFKFRNEIMDAGVFDALKERLSYFNDEVDRWLENNRDLIQQKVPEYIDRIENALRRIWDIMSYDPEIIKWGLVGLAIWGKKGAVVLGGLAHMKTWAENLAKALGLASAGVIDFKDIATANFKELEDLVRKGEALLQGPYFRGKITMPPAKTPGRGLPPPPAGGPPPAEQEIDWLTKLSRGLVDLPTVEFPLETRYYDAWAKTYDARKKLREELTDDIMRLSSSELEYEEWVYRQKVQYLKESGIATDEILEQMAERHKLTMDKMAEKNEKTFGQEMQEAMMGWASGWSHTLNDMLWGAEVTFGKILESFGRMITQMLIQKQVVEPLFAGFGGFVGLGKLFGFEKGGVFGQGRVQAFGSGAVISSPVVFPMARGNVGLAGEKGWEAIMPLARTPTGDLGVKATGAGTNIEIHIHNNARAEVQVRERSQNGQPRLDIFIDDVMSEKVLTGKTARALRTAYGLNPALISR